MWTEGGKTWPFSARPMFLPPSSVGPATSLPDPNQGSKVWALGSDEQAMTNRDSQGLAGYRGRQARLPKEAQRVQHIQRDPEQKQRRRDVTTGWFSPMGAQGSAAWGKKPGYL